MMLYLLRHAEAVDIASSDRDRQLTEKGRTQARHVARFCRRQKLVPGVVVTSPYLRARETAEIVSESLEVPCTVSSLLRCGMEAGAAMAELKSMASFESVMFVGHEPDLSSLAAFAAGLQHHDRLHFRKASLAGLHLEGFRAGQGVLEFLVPVKLM